MPDPNDPWTIQELDEEEGIEYEEPSPEVLRTLIELRAESWNISLPQEMSDLRNYAMSRSDWPEFLAESLYKRYLSERDPKDLDEAIQTWRNYIDSLPENHHDRNRLQDRLTVCLTTKQEETGSEEDLKILVSFTKQLYEAIADDDDRLVIRANNYAKALWQLFRQYRAPEDLNESIRVIERGKDASPEAISILNNERGTILQNPTNRVDLLNMLAALYEERFQLTGSLDDLNHSITVMEKLIKAVSHKDSDGERASWLANLATSLHRRYEQTEPTVTDDLEQIMSYSDEALKDLDEHHPDRAVILGVYAQALGRLGIDTNDVDKLTSSINHLREAYQITPSYGSRLIEAGVNLAMLCWQKFNMTKATEDLDEAVEVASTTLEITPEDHYYRPHVHNCLGLFYFTRFDNDRSEPHAQEALNHLQIALSSTNYTPIYRRVQAGRLILRLCCEKGDWELAYKASVTAIGLLSKMTLRSLKNSDKQRLLTEDDIVGFSSDAAAAALRSGKDGFAALSLLEMGRGTLASSVADLRTDLVSLRREHPTLARRFVSLREDLQTNGPRQNEANKNFEVLLDSIRQNPGFENFLMPPSNRDIHEAAQAGPIIVLNASIYRGVDAILVEKDRLRVLNLDRVKFEDLENWSKDLASLDLMEQLWDTITKPILDALGFTHPSLDNSFPHIWWIPTGILTRFPFHAAGYHSTGSTDAVIDRVMSSYSTSIKALLSTRRRAYTLPKAGVSKSFLVSMATTPDQYELKFAAEEIQEVEELLKSKSFDSTSLKIRPQKKDVIRHLNDCQIFHFAGHGAENRSDPSCSTLLLDDWQREPLTVGSILEVNLSQNNPFLAYLSACQTGQITRTKFHDESIHLISAYQLAGFRHVIGTLWSVDDSACVKMAKTTYQVILKNAITDESVCCGLHIAARNLRDEARNSSLRHTTRGAAGQSKERGLHGSPEDEDGERDMFLVDDSGQINRRQGGEHWIPYVHFGV